MLVLFLLCTGIIFWVSVLSFAFWCTHSWYMENGVFEAGILIFRFRCINETMRPGLGDRLNEFGFGLKRYRGYWWSFGLKGLF